MDEQSKKSGSYLAYAILGFIFSAFLAGASSEGSMNLVKGLMLLVGLIGVLISLLAIIGFFFQFSSDVFKIEVGDLMALVGAVVLGYFGYILVNYEWWPVTDLFVNALGVILIIGAGGLLFYLGESIKSRLDDLRKKRENLETQISRVHETTERMNKEK